MKSREGHFELEVELEVLPNFFRFSRSFDIEVSFILIDKCDNVIIRNILQFSL